MKTEDAKTLAESALDTLPAQLDEGKSASLTVAREPGSAQTRHFWL